jgi:hypothetical protein
VKRSPAPRRRTPIPRPTKPIKRSAPPKRKRPIRRRGKSRYANRPRDLDRMRFVRGLPCAVAIESGTWRWCRRPFAKSEAHHAGAHGLGQKPDDRTCINLCRKCHAALHDGAKGSYFEGWTKERREEWLDDKQSEAISLYEATMGRL